MKIGEGGVIENAVRKREKVVTKTQLAKKIIRKNININTRVVFDSDQEENGEVTFFLNDFFRKVDIFPERRKC